MVINSAQQKKILAQKESQLQKAIKKSKISQSSRNNSITKQNSDIQAEEDSVIKSEQNDLINYPSQ
jgi:hypothetical protein